VIGRPLATVSSDTGALKSFYAARSNRISSYGKRRSRKQSVTPHNAVRCPIGSGMSGGPASVLVGSSYNSGACLVRQMEAAEDCAQKSQPFTIVASQDSALFVRQVHEIAHNLLTSRPLIFWTDLLFTAAVAYGAFAVYIRAANWSIRQTLAFVVCALAFYRAVVFTHEIAHGRPGGPRAFEFVWNLLCGVPLLMPSFLYGDHKSHHSNQSYGTGSDAEYLVDAGPMRATAFLLLSSVYPVLGLLRFLLLTPLILTVRKCDEAVWRRASSLYMMNPRYRRQYDRSVRSVGRWVQEVAACMWAWCIAVSLWSGAVPLSTALKAYFIFLFWMALNQVRALAAHSYSSNGTPSNYVSQVLDSNTFAEGVLLPEVWAPLGMRYHALHHLMPGLPYHAMAEAHARLMRQLPVDSPYRHTLQPSLPCALKQAFQRR